jgi:hypothetical protein
MNKPYTDPDGEKLGKIVAVVVGCLLFAGGLYLNCTGRVGGLSFKNIGILTPTPATNEVIINTWTIINCF